MGVDQFTQAGGAIMEDFDNDGLLDIVITSIGPDVPDEPAPQHRQGDI